MSATKPTIYLAGWSSRRTPGMFGPGAKYTIMLHPNGIRGEYGDGKVNGFTPPPESAALLAKLLQYRRVGKDPDPAILTTYRTMCDAKFKGAIARPGWMAAVRPAQGTGHTVRDGDTLCCACSVAQARAGRCHRAWAAPFLHAAGWRVVLDGREWAPGEAPDTDPAGLTANDIEVLRG